MTVQSFRADGYQPQLDAHSERGRPRTCNLNYIRHALGRADYGDKRLGTYVTLLIDARGFPKPLPTLRKTALTDAVTPDSIWLRAAVDQWLADFLPPEAAAGLDAAAHAAAAAEMDQAAASLSGLRLVGGREA